MNIVSFGKQFIPSLVFLSHILLVLILTSVIALFVFKKKNSFAQEYLSFFQEHPFVFSWIVVVISVSGSLFYSELAKYAPCLLCWVQRLLMYPLLFIIPLQHFGYKQYIRMLVLIMSLIGAVLALYHYGTQLAGTSASCAAFESTVDCAVKYTMYYGYISIPFMAFSAFTLIATMMFLSKPK